MITEHARLAPSSAERWVECPGSVVMQERYPQNEESEEAKEGTASHWVASETLEAYKKAGTLFPPLLEFIDTPAPNGVIITEEMAEGAEVYVEDIISTLRMCGGDISKLHIEERTAIDKVHAESWGTPDAWFFDDKKGILYLWDYKYGHRVIQAYENWQLVEYVLGLVSGLFPDIPEPEIQLDMRVVQPRTYNHEGPVRSWRTFPDMLRAHVNRLQAAAIEALSDSPRTVSGDWCRDCTARHVCQTYQEAAMIAVDVIGDLSADELPPEALGLEIRTLKRAHDAVKYRLEALQVQAIETIKSGKAVPWWGVEQGTGQQKWKKPAAEVFALGDLMGVEVRKKAEPITPKQAIKAGLDASLVESYSTVPLTGLKLVFDDGSKAKRVFTNK